jgi:RNA polymerase sigma-70 factor (ECF subfamily)
LKQVKAKIELPPESEIAKRIENVLTTLYLLFNEGYYSSSTNTVLRQDLCLEAMRLTHMLTENKSTNEPSVNALLALMCFHASRFEARIDSNGELILYHEQDILLWNNELITRGEYYMNKAATGQLLSKYHMEAAIAYWHTIVNNDAEKWGKILSLYNQLLMIEYSPIAALNRTYALSKVYGNEPAIAEAEKLDLDGNHLYHALLGELYSSVNNNKAIKHLQQALKLSRSAADKKVILNKIKKLHQ